MGKNTVIAAMLCMAAAFIAVMLCVFKTGSDADDDWGW